MAKIRVGRVLLWTITILAAFAFVVVGEGKFRDPFWLKAFPRWGYSNAFRMLIGVLEITGGLLLVVPRTALYGAILISIIMLGAVETLVRFHERMAAPVFWIVIVSLIGYARRRQAWPRAERAIPTAADRV